MNQWKIIQHLEYGGPADIFVKLNNIDELKFIVDVSKKQNIPITIIGNGSNILVKDKGIRGIVIKLNFNEVVKENNILNVGSGVLLVKLARIALDNELTGLEFACGIPGTLGGAIFMNAGAYGQEIGDKVIEIKYMDENLNIRTITKEKSQFSYRKSIFQKNDGIILNAKIKLEKGIKENIKKKMDEYSKIRKEKQPLNMPSAGSVFKREENFIPAKLIDECGLKSYSIGDAQISSLHAGFIVNKGNATAKEITELIKYIQNKIKEKYNLIIEPEIRILGED